MNSDEQNRKCMVLPMY